MVNLHSHNCINSYFQTGYDDTPQVSKSFQKSNRAYAIRLAPFHSRKVLDIILFSEMQSPAIRATLALTDLESSSGRTNKCLDKEELLHNCF